MSGSREHPIAPSPVEDTAYPVLPETPSDHPERNEMYVDWEAMVIRVRTPDGGWAEAPLYPAERGK